MEYKERVHDLEFVLGDAKFISQDQLSHPDVNPTLHIQLDGLFEQFDISQDDLGRTCIGDKLQRAGFQVIKCGGLDRDLQQTKEDSVVAFVPSSIGAYVFKSAGNKRLMFSDNFSKINCLRVLGARALRDYTQRHTIDFIHVPHVSLCYVKPRKRRPAEQPMGFHAQQTSGPNNIADRNYAVIEERADLDLSKNIFDLTPGQLKAILDVTIHVGFGDIKFYDGCDQHNCNIFFNRDGNIVFIDTVPQAELWCQLPVRNFSNFHFNTLVPQDVLLANELMLSGEALMRGCTSGNSLKQGPSMIFAGQRLLRWIFTLHLAVMPLLRIFTELNDSRRAVALDTVRACVVKINTIKNTLVSPEILGECEEKTRRVIVPENLRVVSLDEFCHICSGC
jgi:hypothetical protein